MSPELTLNSKISFSRLAEVFPPLVRSFQTLMSRVLVLVLVLIRVSVWFLSVSALCLQGFRTRDGHLVLAAANDRQFVTVCQVGSVQLSSVLTRFFRLF